ncbi:ester cyclase [Herpetosiphon llansteffanensis]|uniref:ester cyclase n=1 Tax=Herpetosiphon llansteffanensis TaxID=2094568 RepID=UPI000D7B9CDE|nr:ester cyclase [Herpetosiphon llansteffanensis]
MSEQITINRQIVHQFIEQCWNQKNLNSIEQLLSNDYVDHAYQPANQAGLIAILEQLGRSFPDHQQHILQTVAEADRVVVQLRFRATHLGEFRGIASTGQTVDVAVYRMYRLTQGRIAEHWALFDTAGLFQQLQVSLDGQKACQR